MKKSKKRPKKMLLSEEEEDEGDAADSSKSKEKEDSSTNNNKGTMEDVRENDDEIADPILPAAAAVKTSNRLRKGTGDASNTTQVSCKFHHILFYVNFIIIIIFYEKIV